MFIQEKWVVSGDYFVSMLMKAWNDQFDLTQLIDECGRLEQGGGAPLSAILYRTWLQRTHSPQAHFAYFNLGATLSNLGELAGAEEAYRRAIALAPEFIQPHLNLGLIMERQGLLDKAVEEWEWVDLNIVPDSGEKTEFLIFALNNLGRVLEISKQYNRSLDYLTKSLALDPNQGDALHHWVFLRQKQCCWPVYLAGSNVSVESMQASTSALAMVAMTDDPAVQLAAARRFSEKKVFQNLPSLAGNSRYEHQKIRIGYCSSDFCLHPVSMLMVELFELHDRDNFEIYGYCWSPEDGSEVRKRVIAAMDHFYRINTLSDEDAARLIRSHEIDILVDLHGQTSGARMNMLAYRPAPIQITYLGLPATTGLTSIDYVIADHYLIPDEEAQYYSEKPLYMPDVYQVSDRKRPVGPTPSRASCGLPEDVFVYCSFNNNFKYTPEMFSVWMNILRRVPGSVLWLLADNPWAETNLRKEAVDRNIDPSRLIFASRVSPENYLARYRIADLFLDSFPFNAGTTANDALWMGLPIVTRSGRIFASRMAGALLTAVKLEELITWNFSDYEEKAVMLGLNRAECQRMRLHLANERSDGVIFDTLRFVRHFEQALCALTDGISQGTTGSSTVVQSNSSAPNPDLHKPSLSHIGYGPNSEAATQIDGEASRFVAVVKGEEVGSRFTEAVTLHQQARLNEARSAYEAILAIEPNHLSTLNNLALLSPPNVAETYLRQALASHENYFDALLNLATILLSSNREAEAIGLFLRALALSPEDERVILGLCQAYEIQGEFDLSNQLLEAKKPGKLDDLYCRLAKNCETINRTDDALIYANRALEINPLHVAAHIYAGRQYLRKGDYSKGADGIAWIWHDRIPGSQIGLFTDPTGQSIRQDGRVILLTADSGLGDTLQFVRYAALLKALGADVMVECQEELVRLIKNMPAVNRVIVTGKVDARFDLRLPLHNLIGAFRNTVDTLPNQIPYLRAYPEEVQSYRSRIETYEGLRVGLCWSGNPGHPRNDSRSIDPDLLTPLIAQNGAVFFSLQKDSVQAPHALVDFSSEFADLGCTAALVENLDLVITVDSAIAHLAGALGRPVWLLNRYDSCWRWLEERSDSPWYPNLTQFRQTKAGTWSDVLSAVSTRLSELISQGEMAVPGKVIDDFVTSLHQPLILP